VKTKTPTAALLLVVGTLGLAFLSAAAGCNGLECISSSCDGQRARDCSDGYNPKEWVCAEGTVCTLIPGPHDPSTGADPKKRGSSVPVCKLDPVQGCPAIGETSCASDRLPVECVELEPASPGTLLGDFVLAQTQPACEEGSACKGGAPACFLEPAVPCSPIGGSICLGSQVQECIQGPLGPQIAVTDCAKNWTNGRCVAAYGHAECEAGT
jgi:hypothetical protein